MAELEWQPAILKDAIGTHQHTTPCTLRMPELVGRKVLVREFETEELEIAVRDFGIPSCLVEVHPDSIKELGLDQHIDTSTGRIGVCRECLITD